VTTRHSSSPPSLERRRFVKSVLVAGAAPFIVPVRLLRSETAPSNAVTLGVLGAGAQGHHDMQDFLTHEDVRVTAICDVNQKNITRARNTIAKTYGRDDVKVFSDFRKMHTDPSIDAILMALPVHWHSIPSQDAVLNKKHIYHEKPMAMSIEEGQRVRAAARETGVVFQFGTQQRSSFYFRWACELALNGRLGEMKEIQVGTSYGIKTEVFKTEPAPDWLDWDRWVGPAPETGFHPKKTQRHFHENMKAFSLGMISCWGIHHMDIARWGQGDKEPGHVRVEGKGVFPESGSCDAIQSWDVRLECEGQAPIRFTDSRTQPHGIQFVGADGSVFVRRGFIKASNPKLLEDPANKCGTMPITLPVSVSHTRNFVDAIKNGTSTISDVEAAMKSDILCQLALIAVEEGRPLKWDCGKERFVDDEAANRRLKHRAFRDEWKLA